MSILTNCSVLIHIHSDYLDIWPIFFDRWNKFGGQNLTTYVCVNKEGLINLEKYISPEFIILYEESSLYSVRIRDALTKINSTYVILYHENNILIDFIDNKRLQGVEQFMNEHNIDQVRLNNSGINGPSTMYLPYISDFYPIDYPNSYYCFSVYPAMWRKTSLYLLMDTFHNHSYREIEDRDVQDFVAKMSNFFVWRPIDKLNQGHEYFGSIIKFSHIILTGKWSYHFDPVNVTNIVKEYNINLLDRGLYNTTYRRPSQIYGKPPLLEGDEYK